jgi:hypothetical protein
MTKGDRPSGGAIIPYFMHGDRTMIRPLAVAASLLIAMSLPAFGQAHPGSHVRPPYPHDPSTHPALDSAQHAALHALLSGTWTGSLTSQGTSSPLQLSIAHDSLHAATGNMTAAAPMRTGAATHFMAVRGDTVRWTQEVAADDCQTTAVVNAHAATAPTMAGTISCGEKHMTFTLRKTAE